MTVVDDARGLRRLLAGADVLLLDFDGPICSVFAGVPAPVVAGRLRGVLASGGRGLPHGVSVSQDPFDVLQYAVTLGPEEAGVVEAALAAYEAEAIVGAVPTPGARELMRAWHGSDRPLVVVSNNSRVAIEAYVARHGLTHLISGISAREDARVDHLKPSPYLVDQALAGRPPASAVFVGDSASDMLAARASAVPFVGYANKPGKVDRLAGAAAVTTSMKLLGDVL
ncbi:HAD family hydrolase [Actinokineospora diospyrosa]|uniref:Phosphoglycolate phosphatase, HAD superfamily n=1 Tax=Actinokineospora diospyrosa TaxID=103728 RepID=A0ABT1IHH8_9PSEU|nr:HAD family hydrolase [Actinokineospora diospyrosa]MCP2272082.1 Phosphoglycolate phosphatase, HAD superfamily [Actinokineospora diospyrosa]